MTPEERARKVYENATGPIAVKRYACDALEAEIARAIREAVVEERERCATIVDLWIGLVVCVDIARCIRESGQVHYIPYGRACLCGSKYGGGTGDPALVTCIGCKKASPGLWGGDLWPSQ